MKLSEVGASKRQHSTPVKKSTRCHKGRKNSRRHSLQDGARFHTKSNYGTSRFNLASRAVRVAPRPDHPFPQNGCIILFGGLYPLPAHQSSPFSVFSTLIPKTSFRTPSAFPSRRSRPDQEARTLLAPCPIALLGRLTLQEILFLTTFFPELYRWYLALSF